MGDLKTAATDDKNQTIFKKSVDSDVIERALSSRPVGALATYEELCALTGRGRARLGGVLRGCVNRLWKVGCYWLVVVGVGVKRVEENECIHKPASRRNRVKRQALMARSELRPIEFNALTAENKMTHTATALAMAVHRAAETPRARAKLLEQIAAAEKKLTMQDAAALILEAKRGKKQG